MMTSNLKFAGPGDKTERIVGEQPGFTVSWKLACGSNIEGTFLFYFLYIVCSCVDYSFTIEVLLYSPIRLYFF